MIAVITGDIINSRKKETALWQKELKKTLNQYGKEPIEWEIYRGDSFQLKLPSEKALMAAIHFKAAIKQIAKLDVRIGIGLGEQDHKAKKITESTGSAFVNSGACFDNLKKQTLAIKTNNEEFNETLNLMMSIATLIMNSWSNTVSEVIIKTIENPKKNQAEIAALMNKSQSSISEALKRGGFEEVKQMEQFYQNKIKNL